MSKCLKLLMLVAAPMSIHTAAEAARGVSEEVAGWEHNYSTWTCGTTNAAAVLLRRNSGVHVPCAGGRPIY